MIEINDQIHLDDSELDFSFVHSSGPGGQNVNKVATAVQLRFDVRGSPNLPEAVKVRLEQIAGGRITTEGVLVIDARRYRSQERNREDAIDRLVDLICKAAETPNPRKKTRPTRASQMKRLEGKKKRGEVKKMRKSVGFDE